MNTYSKASRIAEFFQEKIERGALRAGTHLGTKAALRKEHDVSTGTLNEALRLLQVRGYIRIRPGPRGGAFVAAETQRLKLRHTYLEARADPNYVAMCIQVREELEPLVVVEATKACTEEDARRIHEALERLRGAEGAGDTIMADWDLHRIIARTGKNSVLAEMYCGILDSIQDSVIGYSKGDFALTGVRADTIAVHEDLVRVVTEGDVAAARRTAIMHSPRRPVDGSTDMPGGERKGERADAASPSRKGNRRGKKL